MVYLEHILMQELKIIFLCADSRKKLRNSANPWIIGNTISKMGIMKVKNNFYSACNKGVFYYFITSLSSISLKFKLFFKYNN